ncbi:TonB-dependent hemoglobin/transferrin/lactoferrin family receptor [Vibrio cortegadensis]|uniref:TonB-dependent hemoglobin/transferrin/lactoferrin family receptor n=1 Tax=Vibrio cortegadensis TaxID=1328770 RepID=A0ABV4M896_9VIBR
MSAKKTLLAASIFAAVSPSIYAQDTSNSQATMFDEVVVSATRTEQNLKDVSSSISTVSSNDIDNTMSNSIQDVLKYTPGVTANGGGRFGLSGFTIRGMSDSRIKVLVDGVQQPTPYNPGANEQRKYPSSIEIDTLKVIEVNKGPSSTLYGSDALGGTVLMQTKNPDDILRTDSDENAFEAKTSYNSIDSSSKTTGTWAMREADLETLLMLTYKTGNESETHSNGADIDGPTRGASNPADAEVGNLLAKAFYNLNESHRIGAIVEYYTSQYDEDELSYEGYTIMPGFSYKDNYNKDTTTRLRVGVEHKWTANNSYFDTLESKLNVQQTESLSENYDTTYGSSPSTSGRRMRERIASDDSIQFDAQFDKLADVGDSFHQLTYGISYKENKFSTENTDYKYDLGTVAPGHTDMPDATMTQYGIFLQDQAFLLNEQLVLTAGIRYDSFKAEPKTNDGFSTEYPDSKNDAFTAKLGSVYHFNNNFSALAQISQGFKAPTLQDMYYFYDSGAVIDANPDLKAESSISYEAGIRAQSTAAQIELMAFYNEYSDFINQKYLGKVVGGPNDGKEHYTKENIGSVEIYGVELSSTFLLDEAFDAPKGTYSKLSIAYAEGRDKESGDSIDSVAPLTSNLGLGYDSENHTFGTLLNINMVASKDKWANSGYENINVAGYTLVDLTAYYRPMNDLTVRGGLFNAFDKQYWLYNDMIGAEADDNGLDRKAQAGRNWGIELDYKF